MHQHKKKQTENKRKNKQRKKTLRNSKAVVILNWVTFRALVEGSQYLLMRYFFNLLQGLLNCEKNEFQLGSYSRFLLHCKELIGDRLLFFINGRGYRYTF